MIKSMTRLIVGTSSVLGIAALAGVEYSGLSEEFMSYMKDHARENLHSSYNFAYNASLAGRVVLDAMAAAAGFCTGFVFSPMFYRHPDSKRLSRERRVRQKARGNIFS